MRKLTQKEFDELWHREVCRSFHGMDLSGLRMYGGCNCDFSDSILMDTFIYGYNFAWCNFTNADFTGAVLNDVSFVDCIFKNTKGLPTQEEILDKYFEKTEEGYIVYKVFGLAYNPPSCWRIKEDSIIEEKVDMDRGRVCSYGINVATLSWIMRNFNYNNQPIWKCIISFEDFNKVCVPYGTDGKVRCGRLKLLEIVE